MKNTKLSRAGFIDPVTLSLLGLGALGVFQYKTGKDVQQLQQGQAQQGSELVELRTGLNETREVVNSHSKRLDKLESFTPQTSGAVFGIAPREEGN